MKRLTSRDGGGDAFVEEGVLKTTTYTERDTAFGKRHVPYGDVYYGNVIERLAQYEDAEGQGRLVVLPCKVGDTVYADIDGTGSGFYDACIISEIKIMKDHAEPLFTALCYEKGDYQTYWASDFGKEVFLAPSDAKKKQKRPLTRDALKGE